MRSELDACRGGEEFRAGAEGRGCQGWVHRAGREEKEKEKGERGRKRGKGRG